MIIHELSLILPLIGISIAERLRDRGFDTTICFDDFSKHSKSYRQISLILDYLLQCYKHLKKGKN